VIILTVILFAAVTFYFQQETFPQCLCVGCWACCWCSFLSYFTNQCIANTTQCRWYAGLHSCSVSYI